MDVSVPVPAQIDPALALPAMVVLAAPIGARVAVGSVWFPIAHIELRKVLPQLV